MPHHCTVSVIPPRVDVKIATDSSFLSWGSTMGHASIAGLWEWERLCSHINKKELQTCFIAVEYSCSAVGKKYCCCKLSESCGGRGTRSQALLDRHTVQLNGVHRERFIFQQFTYQVL